MEELWIVHGWLAGEIVDVHVRDGRIVDLSSRAPAGARVIDARGLWLSPAFIDAHVHLGMAGPDADRRVLAGGVAAVLDLGAPEPLLPLLAGSPLRVVFSGPLFTAPGGYPTQSWGASGYGLELSTPPAARAAVQRLAGAGARFLKLAFDARYPVLDATVARAASDEAHRLGLTVAAHALDEEAVRRALQAGADVFAHTPTSPLSDELLRRIPIVVSTLHAFGGPLENLRALHRLGARIVYGTDLGNPGTTPGIDARELVLLREAGLSPREILDAATVHAAALLGLADLGRLETGFRASLLALRSDPAEDATALARPAFVLIDGVRQGAQE